MPLSPCLGKAAPGRKSIPTDDPCWGGPDLRRHDLRYLLGRIEAGVFGDGNDGDGDGDGVNNAPRNHRTGNDGEEELAPNGDGNGGRERTRRRGRRMLILHEDDSYVVLNKPPDLRMDGPHAATAHKLLTYWYPSPSLLDRASAAGSLRAGSMNDDMHAQPSPSPTAEESHMEMTMTMTMAAVAADARDEALLSEVSNLSKHNEIHDNDLRPTHQLDYATSGVLLVARTRRAAGAACMSFQDRRAKKTYLAVVRGHVDCRGMPVLGRGALATWMDGSVEGGYRRSRIMVGKGTFEGYMPPHAMFHRWKGMIGRRRRAAKRETVEGGERAAGHSDFQKKRKKERPSTDGWTAKVGDEVLETKPSLGEWEVDRLLGIKWAEAKKDPKFKKMFQDMSDKYNDTLKAQKTGYAPPSTITTLSRNGVEGGLSSERVENDVDGDGRKKDGPSPPLPRLFRIEGEDPDAFYVHAPLAERRGDFRCYVDQDSLSDSSDKGWYCAPFPPGGGDEGGGRLDHKPSLTRCVVLWRGKIAGGLSLPVSKVRLEPRTGRRHQLRLHMAAVAGHPIVGDETYGGRSSGDDGDDNDGGACHRMCLHARSLCLPLLGGTVGNFSAPDPFVVCGEADGRDGAGVIIVQGGSGEDECRH